MTIANRNLGTTRDRVVVLTSFPNYIGISLCYYLAVFHTRARSAK